MSSGVARQHESLSFSIEKNNNKNREINKVVKFNTIINLSVLIKDLGKSVLILIFFAR